MVRDDIRGIREDIQMIGKATNITIVVAMVLNMVMEEFMGTGIKAAYGAGLLIIVLSVIAIVNIVSPVHEVGEARRMSIVVKGYDFRKTQLGKQGGENGMQ